MRIAKTEKPSNCHYYVIVDYKDINSKKVP